MFCYMYGHMHSGGGGAYAVLLIPGSQPQGGPSEPTTFFVLTGSVGVSVTYKGLAMISI